METLGPLHGAGICVLPPTQCHPALGAGQTEGFGDIFLDNTMEISPLISMPGRAPFSTHPLALSSASSLTQSCLSAPALLLFQPRLSPEESLTPCRGCFCHQLGVTVTFGDIGSCFFCPSPFRPWLEQRFHLDAIYPSCHCRKQGGSRWFWRRRAQLLRTVCLGMVRIRSWLLQHSEATADVTSLHPSARESPSSVSFSSQKLSFVRQSSCSGLERGMQPGGKRQHGKVPRAPGQRYFCSRSCLNCST